ncbi:MAG: hypothetical protein F2630_06805, partial [Actinobacteria bacterium]|nr:hypothetical protein [Actinomycetota bacterium]
VWGTFQAPSEPTRRPERLTIGTDPTDERRRQTRDVTRDVTGDFSREYPRDPSRDITGGVPRGGRPQPVRRAGPRGPRPGIGGRDMPAAVTTGLILVAAFLGAIMWRPAAVMLIVLAVVGLAAVEFFSKVTEKGYRPATFAGLITCIAAPLAAYWMGDGALPLVFAFGFLATSIGFLGATSIQSGPMPNVAITTMAMTWIGLMGAFAALILRYSVNGAGAHVGTDTLFMVVVAVIANDIGGLFVGSSVGRTPLREWVSPNKTIEGAVGGALASIVALIIFGSQNGTWDSMGEWIALGLVVAAMAPLGDLVESMFKRNLDVKDFGSIVAGHGGVLDRFDGFLFVLPAAYYLMLVLQPWL